MAAIFPAPLYPLVLEKPEFWRQEPGLDRIWTLISNAGDPTSTVPSTGVSAICTSISVSSRCNSQVLTIALPSIQTSAELPCNSSWLHPSAPGCFTCSARPAAKTKLASCDKLIPHLLSAHLSTFLLIA